MKKANNFHIRLVKSFYVYKQLYGEKKAISALHWYNCLCLKMTNTAYTRRMLKHGASLTMHVDNRHPSLSISATVSFVYRAVYCHVLQL